jgi:hypothetical protein
MNPVLVADSVVDLCGALGLCVAMLSVRRRDPRGPMTQRFLWAFGLVASVFLLRSLGWWLGSVMLGRLAMACAAAIPLGVLAVTEGALRRHAPRSVKLAVLIGSALMIVASLLGLADVTPIYNVALAGLQLATFAVCGVLLHWRDRSSLTSAEDAGVSQLGLCAFLMLPFLLTDFRELLPAMPIRLGGLGALVLISLVLVQSGTAPSRRQGFTMLGLRILSALLLSAAAALVADSGWAESIRLGAIILAGFLATGLVVDALGGSFEAGVPSVLASIAQSRARGREALIADLAANPLFENAQRLQEPALTAFDPDILRPALQDVAVLRVSQQPWGALPTAPATERLAALMATHSASHLLVISDQPLDLLLMTIPVVSADPATETALILVRRMLATAPEDAPT